MPVEDPAIIADAPEADAEVTPGITPDAPVEEDPFAPVAAGEPQSFDKTYVEKLRREGAKYRTAAKERADELERLKPYEETFSGYEPEQVEGWQAFIREAIQDPEGALAYLIKDGFSLDRDGATAIMDAIYADAGDVQPEAVPAGAEPDDDDRPMTVREFRAMEEAKAQEAASADAVASVRNEAKDLGYVPDGKAGSLEEFRYQRLLSLAANVTGNDLGKAHEALEAEEQALVKSRMDALAQEADALPTPTGNGGPGAAADTSAKDLNTAGVNAREWLKAQLQTA